MIKIHMQYGSDVDVIEFSASAEEEVKAMNAISQLLGSASYGSYTLRDGDGLKYVLSGAYVVYAERVATGGAASQE